MAWTNPLTWAVSQLVTAAQLNTHIRDNMNETAPAKVTTAGDIVYATAANALARLGIGSAGQILTVVAGLPAWAANLVVGGAAPATDTYTNTEGASTAVARRDHNHAQALTTASADLGSNVAINVSSGFFDGPSLALGAGTWEVIAKLLCQNNSGVSGFFVAKLWDGTTVFDAMEQYSPAVSTATFTLSLVAFVTGPVTVKVSATYTNQPATILVNATSAGTPGPVSRIRATRIA